MSCKAMSVSVLASLRPLNGPCLATARAGLLSLRVTPRGAPSFSIQATVPLQHGPRRYSSKPGPEKKDASKAAPQPVQQQVTFRQFTGRLLGASLRNLTTALTPRAIRKAYREAPVQIGGTIVL